MRRWLLCLSLVVTAGLSLSFAESPPPEKTAAERGREALLKQAFAPPLISQAAYGNLWKQWGVKEKPADYDKALRERYGLHTAPYDNAGLPMGLREGHSILGKGVTND